MKTLARWSSASVGTAAALFCLSAYFMSPPYLERIQEAENDDRDLEFVDRRAGIQYRFVAILSDVQSGFHYLPKLLDRVPKHSAIVMLGDLSADHDEAHMQLPVRELQRHAVPGPLYAVPGNHDIRGEAGAAEWARWFGARTFRFGFGSAIYLGLDNSQGPLNAAALSGLREELEDAKKRRRRTVLCLHRDVVDWEGKRKKVAEEANRALLDLIKDYDVPLVLMGHWHEAIEVRKGNTRFVVVPPSGDTSRDTGALPVTLTILKYDGKDWTIEYERIERDFWTDLEGFYLHMALAHVRPQPLWTVGALLACAAGWWLFVRWKKAPAASTIAPEVKA